MKKGSKDFNDINSNSNFTNQIQIDLNYFFKFLQLIGNEDKLHIIDSLRKNNSSKSQLAKKLNKTPSTISHHIHVLEEQDIVRGIKDGKFIRYSLNRDKFGMFLNNWNQWISSITNWE